ncbi:substrate-binding domain-containing protein, partial [Ruegeria sp. 2205SS24-7]|uniref:substrate-binding domain-containing protein n=1 Tax=Ruegeria discodermiae TaxID=3064389 RepID=UPI00274060E9
RHIAYFGGVAKAGGRSERIAGYEQALVDFNLDPPVIWDYFDDKISGLNALKELHAAHPEITALVCNVDMVAIGACLGISQLGMQPGREISVIGFDDIQDAAVATPPLTTMAVSPYQMGRKLARVVLDRIKDPQMPKSISSVPAELVVRETTGPVG